VSRSLRILVIEDDREIARALLLRLQAVGHDGFVMHDGKSGLAAAVAAIPDLVILDLRLPDMDGLDVLQQLQQHEIAKVIPVIVVSANVAERAKREAMLLGADGFIEKPYDFRKLAAAIDRACAARSTSAAVSGRDP
jgi:two-component system, OmpR family, KDP operon response regulator KdpE